MIGCDICVLREVDSEIIGLYMLCYTIREKEETQSPRVSKTRQSDVYKKENTHTHTHTHTQHTQHTHNTHTTHTHTAQTHTHTLSS